MSFSVPRAAMYARFSSDNQRTESIDAQIRAMKKYCQQQHWQIVATYLSVTENIPLAPFGVSLVATSYKGKTTALQLAASIYSAPTDEAVFSGFYFQIRFLDYLYIQPVKKPGLRKPQMKMNSTNTINKEIAIKSPPSSSMEGKLF